MVRNKLERRPLSDQAAYAPPLPPGARGRTVEEGRGLMRCKGGLLTGSWRCVVCVCMCAYHPMMCVRACRRGSHRSIFFFRVCILPYGPCEQVILTPGE